MIDIIHLESGENKVIYFYLINMKPQLDIFNIKEQKTNNIPTALKLVLLIANQVSIPIIKKIML